MGFLFPVCSDFWPLVPIGYLLTTIAAGFTPRPARTILRAVTLVLIGAVFPFVAVELLVFAFKLFGHPL